MTERDNKTEALNKAYVEGSQAYFRDPTDIDGQNRFPEGTDYHQAFRDGFEDQRRKDEK